MTINKVQGSGFAQIANAALRDTRLSFKARGVLAMVLSYSGDWESPRDWLEKMSDRDGRDSIQSALNELTDLGYRKVVKVQKPDGTWLTEAHWFHTPPEPTEGRVFRPSEKPTVGEPVLLSEHHPQNTESAPLDDRLTQFSLIDAPPAPKVKGKTPAKPIPSEWLDMDVPPKELADKAREVGLSNRDIGVAWRSFVSWHASKDTRYSKWAFAWRNWAQKEVERNKGKTRTETDPKTGIQYGPPGLPDDAWMYRQDYDVNPLEGIK